ncbi:MAG: hypothetical protein QOJ89_2976 [bacterium]|jgi:hypothetical protein
MAVRPWAPSSFWSQASGPTGEYRADPKARPVPPGHGSPLNYYVPGVCVTGVCVTLPALGLAANTRPARCPVERRSAPAE